MKPHRDVERGTHEARGQTLSENGTRTEESDRSPDRRKPFLKRVVVLGAAGAILLALFGLLGYIPGLGLLGRVHQGYIPMAPSTAISFIMLGGILLVMTFRSLSGANLVIFGSLAVLVSLFGALEVAGHFIGRDLNFENVLVPGAGYLGEIPIARMSPSTGALFLLAGAGAFALLLRVRTHGRGIRLGHCGGSLGCLVFGIGLVFCLAYIFGSPLLYGRGATVPMALTTALAFLMLGSATVGVSGEEAIPASLLAPAQRSGKPMSERKRFIFLVFIMVGACAMVMVVITTILYRHDINDHRELLQATAQSQARMIEAMARHDSIYEKNTPGGPTEATLSQIIDAHNQYQGFGKTGEFTLARREGNSIVFILRHRHNAVEHPASVAFDSDLAEPMRRALAGLSGTVIDLDYRGETVLAAHEPVAVLNLGIVAKIDLAEIRAPFIRSSLLAAAAALLVVLAGTALFFRIGNPIIARLQAYSRDLEKQVEERKRAEEALRQYSHIVSSSTDMLALLDKNCVYLAANAVYLAAFEKTRDELIGHRAAEVFGQDFFDASLRPHVEHCLAGRNVRYQDWFDFPAKGKLYMDIAYSPYVGADQEIKGFVVSGRDITELKQTAEELKRLRRQVELILNAAGEGIYGLDCYGDTTFVNPAAAQFIGWEPEDLIGRNQHTVMHHSMPDGTPYPQEKCPIYAAYKDGKVHHVDNEVFWRKDGSSFPVEYVCSPIRNEQGEIEGAVVVFRDITDRKRAEEAIRRSEERLQLSIQNMPIAFVVWDTQWRIMEWNNEAENIFGFTKAEVLGTSVLDCIVPEAVRPIVGGLMPDFKVGQLVHYSEPDNNIRKDGKLISCRWSNTPLLNERGEVFAILAMAEDITEHLATEKQIKRQQYYLEKGQELGQIGTWELDLRINKLYWTDENCRIFGVPPGSVVNYEIFMAKIHPEDREYVEQQWNAALEGKPYDIEHRIVVDDTTKWVREKADLEFDKGGSPVKAIGFTQDITDRKGAEEAREELVASLEEKNAELERFTYTVSHDLKSPLITIKGFLGMLEEDAVQGNIEQLKGDISHISKAAEKMHRLLDELLELSQIGRLPREYTEISMAELAREAVEQTIGSRTGKKIEINISPDLPVVYGNRNRLFEVMQNLVDNAAKFMDKQSEPLIEIGVRQDQGQTVCYVRDNGIGIDPRYHQKIFGLFDQLDQKYPGTGIGLSIVKRIIEVHGGRIWVESQGLGCGSTFCFTTSLTKAQKDNLKESGSYEKKEKVKW